MSKFLYKSTKSASQLKTIIFPIKFLNPVLQLLRLSHWRLDSSWPRLCAGNQIEKDWKWRRQHREKSKTGMQRLWCGGFKRKEKQMWCWGGECEQQGLQLEQLCGWWCWSQCGCGNTLLKRGTSNDHFHEILPSFSPHPLSPTDCHIFVFIRGVSIVNIIVFIRGVSIVNITIDVTHQLNTL